MSPSLNFVKSSLVLHEVPSCSFACLSQLFPFLAMYWYITIITTTTIIITTTIMTIIIIIIIITLSSF